MGNGMEKKEIYKIVENLASVCQDASRFIWENPELGGEEKKSADYYRTLLKKEGFRIVDNSCLEHAFYAEYGEGKPVIAVLCEYDALPGLSQKRTTKKEAVTDGAPGHGCGHNLLGSAAATAAIAIKEILKQGNLEGTVRLYGCPEEELLCGKVKMAYHHMFDGCDLALSWHPMCANMVFDKAYLASASAKFYFKGISSHAGFAPERGRSALDAVELMNVGVNYLREHVIDKTRIHYTTDSGGYAPNIVPPNASSWYYVRAPYITDVQDTLERIKKVARGAAMMTETEVEIKLDSGCCEMKRNSRFADLTFKNLEEAGSIEYTPDELEFANKLQSTLEPAMCKKEKELYHTQSPMYTGTAPRNQWEITPLTASTDGGDVSYMMPMNLFTTACWPVGVAPHTWQACASAGTSIGEKAALLAAKVIAGTAFDLYTEPETVEEIKKEFNSRPSSYKPMYEE